MPDVYIDRWAVGSAGQLTAIFIAALPPPDAPKPESAYVKGLHRITL
jgi:hypothetical protein